LIDGAAICSADSTMKTDVADGGRPIVCEHVLASVAEPGAGPSYSVRALTKNLATEGASVRLRTIEGWRAGSHEAQSPPSTPGERHGHDFRRIPVLKGLAASRDMERALRNAAETTDLFHSHGLWLMPNIYPAWAARGTAVKLVVSPRGMLAAEALAFSSMRKAVFWRLLQAHALRSAHCLHATGEAEYADVRAAGLSNPVAVIPNGVDLPPAICERRPTGARTALSLGRIHPKKGLDQLIRAWARVEAMHPDWRLRIVGPAELGHDLELVALTRALNLKTVSVEGPLFGEAKAAAYRSADLFVLSTRNENFAMTVAEALAAGVPVISTKGAPWAGLALPQGELAAMGARGRAWMARDFGWDRIAVEMLSVYRWLARGAEPPKAVRFD
jgi:glycosyltransferase involved in cell wall biosynthesis